MKLIRKNECLGCGACHDVCEKSSITMKRDCDGFIYPNIDETLCTKCGRCVTHCPVSCEVDIRKKNEQLRSDSYMVWNLDSEKRKAGSSGGIFSVFAGEVLKSGGVVIGAAFDEKLHVKHIIIDKVEEVNLLSGSKYLQSDTTGIYKKTKEILEAGRAVLFSGTPCQIMALETFLGKPMGNLFTCEIFYHGVPSPGLFKDYVAYLERREKSKVIKFNFRSKKAGWALPNVSIALSNGKVISHRHRDNLFMSWFGKHLSVRHCCFNCIARKSTVKTDNVVSTGIVQRVADISIGDFWGIQKFKNVDTSFGVSALLVNSEKGLNMFQVCSSKMYYECCEIQDIIEKNQYLIEDYPIPKGRDVFFARYKKMNFTQFSALYKSLFFIDLVFNKVKFELSKLLRVN
jgi:Pyruvate/2-oxoacid:ferredoxin oxidoreductase delta subunit